MFYVLVPEDTTFSNLNSAIVNNRLYKVANDGSEEPDIDLTTPYTSRTLDQIKLTVNKIYNTFMGDSDYSSLRIYQVVNTAVGNNFGIYINNNGDRLHRIPKKKFYTDPDYDWGTHSFYTYGIYVDVPQLPDGYIGWFISYEKFEPIQRVTGFLTRNDFRTISKVRGANGNIQDTLDTSNCKMANTMFYIVVNLTYLILLNLIIMFLKLNYKVVIHLRFVITIVYREMVLLFILLT